MNRSVIETIMGAVVLVVAGLFLYLANEATDLSASESGYSLSARFGSIDGLTLGSDVRIGGVKVGSVIDQSIDPEFYEAVVQISIQNGVRIPADSSLSVASDGFLGGNFLKLVPGIEEEILEDGGEILDTKDAVALEDLLGRAIFLLTDE
ncbi:MAG: outer membrane lipid asymmetry maintenance protein MlaD [Alphaproteobacteria bacterium]